MLALRRGVLQVRAWCPSVASGRGMDLWWRALPAQSGRVCTGCPLPIGPAGLHVCKYAYPNLRMHIHARAHTQAAARGGSAGLLQRGGSKRLVLAQVREGCDLSCGWIWDGMGPIMHWSLTPLACPSVSIPTLLPHPKPPYTTARTNQATAARLSTKIGAAVFTPTDQFEDRHIGPSLEDEKVMLQTIGAS